MTRSPSPTAPLVVIGGLEYADGVNQTTLHTVRESARHRPTLYLYSERSLALTSIVGRRQPGMGASPATPSRIARALLPWDRPPSPRPNVTLAPLRGPRALLPISQPEPLRRSNLRYLTRTINRWASRHDEAPMLAFYWWFFPELLERVPHSRAVYDCIDEHSAYPNARPGTDRQSQLEQQLLDGVNRSFVVADALLPGRAATGRRIDVLPNGFDLSLLPPTAPEARPAGARPVVGYAGGLGDRIDAALMERVARAHPEWDFRFVGGDPETLPPTLRALPNVTCTGQRPYSEVLREVSRFDVALVPFRVTDFTLGNSLLKLLDYFAFGVPVVSTPLPEPVELSRQPVPLAAVAADADGFGTAIRQALGEPANAPARSARIAWVRDRSTAARTARLLAD
ncbi:MAG: glycosyltransferase [Solirubrobacteraceae bacterium]|nr:glycosyltransferase [Solirubrobacteraceae bacterium]